MTFKLNNRQMKNKKQILYILLALLIQSCIPESENGLAEAELNGIEWNSETAIYEQLDDKVEITLAGNDILLTIHLTETNSNEYDLSADDNYIEFFDGNSFTQINNGIIKINSPLGSTISGEFEFNYEPKKNGEYSIEAHYGHFYDLPILNKNITKDKTINKNNFMFVDGNKGELDIQNQESKLSYDNKKISLEINGYENRQFNIDINEIDNNAISTIFHVSDKTIKNISIDKLNKKRVTIMYHDGNSLTLF